MLAGLTSWQGLNLLDEQDCEEFRTQVFPLNNRISLNPSTLGVPSMYVTHAIKNFYSNEIQAYPLEVYKKGRLYLKESREIASSIWRNETYNISFSFSTSNLINLIGIQIVNYLKIEKEISKISILTSKNEHNGGIAFFKRHPFCEVNYLLEEDTVDVLSSKKYHVLFISFTNYNLGRIHDVEKIIKKVRSGNSEIIVILDVAQSLGVYPFDLSDADFIVSSTHKWLFGPYGLGILLFKKEVIRWLPSLNYNGDYLDSSCEYANYELSGGQDFSLYAGLYESLLLFKNISVECIYQKSSYLCAFLVSEIREILQKKNIFFKIYGRNGEVPKNKLEEQSSYAGFFSISLGSIDVYPIYQKLNTDFIHVKCIKNDAQNLLRIGLPYYETKERLKKVIYSFKNILTHS